MNRKQIGAFLLAGLMAVTGTSALTSCKKDKGPVMSRRTNVYAGDPLEIPEGINYIQNMFTAGENVYIMYYTEYSIVRDQNGEEQLRKTGYYYTDMNYEYDYAIEEPVIEVMPAVNVAAAVAVETASPVVEAPEAETSADVDADGDGIADAKTEPEQKERPKSADEIVFGEQYSSVLLPDGWYFDYQSVQSLAKIPLDGSKMTVSELPTSDPEAYSSAVAVSNDGFLYMIMQKWVYNEETQMGETQYKLDKYKIDDGSLISSADLNEVLRAVDLDPSSYYLGSLVINSAGHLFINAESMILELDADGNYVGNVEIDSGWINQLSGMDDKLLVTYYSETANSTMVKIMENGELTDVSSETLKGLMQNYYGIYGAGENKLYYGTASGLWQYDFTTDTASELLNYINSDIDYNTVVNTRVLPDGRVLLSTTDWNASQNQTELCLMEKIPDEQLQDEIIVTLGCTNNNYQVTKAIISYNKQNTGIRISVRSYEHYNNQDNEWTGAVTQFNNDIITGNLPDIVLITSDLPSASYFKKGIFADLNRYIDDPEVGLDRSKYLSNVLEACSMDGKLYSIILSFRIRTLMAKSEYVGTEPGWTFEDMMEMIAQMPEGTRAFFDFGRDEIINNFFNMAMGSFVDWETGKTKFDSPGFIEFIKYLSTCPEKGYWNEYYESMGDNYVYDEDKEREMQENWELRHYRGLARFEFAYLSSFTALLEQMNTFASRDITAIGFPTEDETSNGAMILPNLEFAISAKSSVKDQAWQVIRFLMNDEQVNENTYQFSINLDIMEKNLANAKDNYYYYDSSTGDYSWYEEYGYSQEYIDYIKNRNIPFDQEACNAVMDLVKGAKEVQRSDSALVDIIKEELSVFFAGSRSAEETARIIASRANIYIAENS